MTLLIATAAAATANSYLTMARAKAILRARLYTSAWDDAASTPDADDYVVNNGAGYNPGDSTIAIDGGTGSWTVGTVIQFEGHDTEYTLTAGSSTSLSFSPVLTAAIADDEVINRLTPNTREKALMFATRVIDEMMQWYGTIRTTTQALRWPRAGVVDRDGNEYDYDTVPGDIEEATAELALAFLDSDRFKTPELLGQGFREAKLGEMEVKVDRTMVEEAIPDNIRAMLAHMGEINVVAAKGMKVIKLDRA